MEYFYSLYGYFLFHTDFWLNPNLSTVFFKKVTSP